MKRIGIAASKISRGNRWLYNFYVILISVLLSLALYLIVGATVIFSLAIIKYVAGEVMGVDFDGDWASILSVCMVSLTVVVALFNVFGILINLKLNKLTD